MAYISMNSLSIAHSPAVAPPFPCAFTRSLNMLCFEGFISIFLFFHVAWGSSPPPSTIYLPTSAEYVSLHLPVWSNLRQLVREMDRGVINITTPSTPALFSQLKKEAKQLRSMFPSTRSPRSILSIFGIAAESQVIKDELLITDIAAAQRNMREYVNTYDTLYKSIKDAVLAEEAEIADILHIQTQLLRSVGAAALTENLRHLTRLFKELNTLAVRGSTGSSPSDVLRLPAFAYVAGIDSNATTVSIHLLVPHYEHQLSPVVVSHDNFKCYVHHNGYFFSLESCSDSFVDPMALSFRVLPQKLHPNTLRVKVGQIDCVKSQVIGKLVKYCLLNDNVVLGFDSHIIGNHSESFKALQASNLSMFYGRHIHSQTEAVIENLRNLKSIHIPNPVHWTNSFLHPWMAPVAFLLASLSLLMHFKNYLDQFKMKKRVRLELEKMEGEAS